MTWDAPTKIGGTKTWWPSGHTILFPTNRMRCHICSISLFGSRSHTMITISGRISSSDHGRTVRMKAFQWILYLMNLVGGCGRGLYIVRYLLYEWNFFYSATLNRISKLVHNKKLYLSVMEDPNDPNTPMRNYKTRKTHKKYNRRLITKHTSNRLYYKKKKKKRRQKSRTSARKENLWL